MIVHWNPDENRIYAGHGTLLEVDVPPDIFRDLEVRPYKYDPELNTLVLDVEALAQVSGIDIPMSEWVKLETEFPTVAQILAGVLDG